ncbi:MAG: deoxynucleoside kinase [Candidatus Marinimicrobia bacterium]|nr:deoxynucleoside kinase [Candidatus Neomarinimicrobiota bacterium]|tara:strand:- start:3544 stop:4164 length:621 start_codon:yes stop_codon:yes gene_type:complete
MTGAPFIGIAGNIGVGKTTFTRLLAERYSWDEYYESVIDNPYLSDFYGDMNRWSFNLQIYFLQHRFASQIDMSNNEKGVIQDRTIYEDVEIFARNLHSLGHMSNRDWNTYRSLFQNMVQFLKKPDIIIYLKASTDTLISRIKKRNRAFEKNIDPEYLHQLNTAYNTWTKNEKKIKILVIDTDNFNVFKDKEKLDAIYKKVEDCLEC